VTARAYNHHAHRMCPAAWTNQRTTLDDRINRCLYDSRAISRPFAFLFLCFTAVRMVEICCTAPFRFPHWSMCVARLIVPFVVDQPTQLVHIIFACIVRNLRSVAQLFSLRWFDFGVIAIADTSDAHCLHSTRSCFTVTRFMIALT
jgi:hypothetical protein